MKVFFRLLLLIVVIAVLAAVMEVTFRILDRRASAPAAPGGSAIRRYVDSIPMADGVSREWFDLSPAPLARPPLTPELAVVAERVSGLPVSVDMFKQWNARMIQDRLCAGEPFFEQFPGFAFSFDPPEPSIHPPYRYLPSTTTPKGLVTNRFGFRGHEITPDKPARTVRIAFVGASTTVGSHDQPFSYPELIERWLNAWAERWTPGVQFEAINAGREGISSPDIAAIVSQELVPLEPDVIVYHEGANQFLPHEMAEGAGQPFVAPATLESTSGVPGTGWSALLRRLDVAVRRYGFGPGAEPRKPKHHLRWPASVSEGHPDPDGPELPVHLTQVVHDLDDILRSSKTIDATVVMTSFIWMVKDGLVVDRVNRGYYYDFVNRKYWPATYAEMRRLADFQNRVFEAYASSRKIPFVDASGRYPLDIELFGDPVHMTPDGDRLRAWVIFQGLIPVLRNKLAAGQLPVADRSALRVAPLPAALPRNPLVCTDYSHEAPIAGALSLQSLIAVAGAVITGDSVKHVVTSSGWNSYAAEAPVALNARVAGSGVVRVKARVSAGSVAVGILRRDRKSFLAVRRLDAGHGATDIYLPVPWLADAGSLVVSNAANAPGQRSVVDIEEAAVLVPAR